MTRVIVYSLKRNGRRGDPQDLKFKLSLSPEANIVMYIHIHSDI